ncbi:MAG TPA: metal-binding protein [Cyanothece sp. UBA12306]|nr:metal-binding protein [Cyanothece sp. UBA12306]
MQSLYIPHLLQLSQRTQTISLEDFIPGLDTLTPLRGKMTVRHGGTFLEIKVQAETIITLTCDRCLQQYNHRVILDTSEIIWLDKNANLSAVIPQEREIAWEDLSETLSPDSYFEPEIWLYEQLSLTMPLRKLCGKDCQQLMVPTNEEPSPIDSRWASLESLKQQLSS